MIDKAEQMATEKEIKYKGLQRVRRFFMVGDDKIEPSDPLIGVVLECLSQRLSSDDKYYALQESMQQFRQTYPFVLIREEYLTQVLIEQGQQAMEKERMYPYAKFPAEIIPGKLYLVVLW